MPRTASTTTPVVLTVPRRQGGRWLLTALVAISVLLLTAVSFVVYQNLQPASARDQADRKDQPVLPRSAPQRTLTQVTYGAGLQAEPTWSPDGRFLAYSSDRSGNFDIWVQQVGSGEPLQLTTDPAHDWQPNWSPDGKQIAFRSERGGGGLFVVPFPRGREKKIASFGYRPRWSPDGSQILFQSSALRDVTQRSVYVTALDGSPPREVVTEFHRLGSVAWHPDGRGISCWAYDREHKFGWWTVPLDGGAPLKWKRAPAVEEQFKTFGVDMDGDMAWAPSGQAIYFEGVSRNVHNLWTVQVDPKASRLIGGPERLTVGAGRDSDVVVSPDGKKLAFTIRTSNTRLWSFPFDATTGQATGQGQSITAADMDVFAPDISRDGKKLVFGAERAGKIELWEKSLEDGREHLLAADDCERAAPTWSRDGTRLVYRRDDPHKHESSLVLLPIGGEEQVLTSPHHWFNLSDWSADDTRILGCLPAGPPPNHTAIWLLPVAAAPRAEAQARVLASKPDYDLWQARFSPNERWICFLAVLQNHAVSTIYVMPASGGAWIPITDGKQCDDKPRWSPDGKTIYFMSPRTGFFNLWGIRFDPDDGKPVGEPFLVKTFESPGRYPSPGGMELALGEQRFVLPLMQLSGNIWVLENVDR